jgi:uncharacterized protein YqjF (DUF2071 family)
MRRPLLSARWRNLLFLNYAIDPDVLRPRLPAGVALDLRGGVAYASLVGLQFLDGRPLGIPLPFYGDFAQINLRFYVRRELPEGAVRRGVVFVKQVVPRRLVTLGARLLFQESYVTRRADWSVEPLDPAGDRPGAVAYRWRDAGRWNEARASIRGAPQPMPPNSLEAFFAERFWGYAAQRGGSTLEYRVAHPPWHFRPAEAAELDCDVRSVYGEAFADALSAEPVAPFVAEGSEASAFPGTKLPAAKGSG